MISEQIREDLELVKKTLRAAEVYEHAWHIVNFDRETICPPGAVEEKGELAAFLEGKAFEIRKSADFTAAFHRLYDALESGADFPEGPDRDMVKLWHLQITREEKITPQMAEEYARLSGRAFADWLRAKEEAKYPLFADSLEKMIKESSRMAALRGPEGADPYDVMLDEHERGMSCADLDEIFGVCTERLVPLLRKVTASKKKIRTDFLSRPVPLHAQQEMSYYLLSLIGFDLSHGALSTAEHPFTDGISRRDVRLTTHYYPDCFSSNMFSVMHEGGHALFEQNQLQESHDFFLTLGKTGGQHESVSRFYENVIGRSKAFTDLIYPKTKELFGEAMADVSAREFYEGMNVAGPTLIRTEADELTYTLHVIIRYEIEKQMIAGRIGTAQIPEVWNSLYEKYLGIRPANDREGVLQDVHWTDGFGYFPSYALGNIYNAMYYNRMKQDLDTDALIRSGNLTPIGSWMTAHVYAKADVLAPREWIRDITGRELTPEDFLNYLEEKYGELYEL